MAENPIAANKITVPAIVAIGVIITVAITVGSWTWVVGSQFSGMRDQIRDGNQALGERINEIKNRIDMQEVKMSDRWTATDQRVWSSELARRNRDLNVPEVGR
jgi:uncharacterized iron-regulated membrane protein